jgi:flagellar protein FliO/FliZ
MFAAPQVTPVAHPSAISSLGQMTLALLLVLAVIFALAWLMRQLRGRSGRVGGAIDVVANVPLGQKERAVLLRVGSNQILIGVSPGHINTLYVLPEPLELTGTSVSTAAERTPSFRALLLRGLGK